MALRAIAHVAQAIAPTGCPGRIESGTVVLYSQGKMMCV